MTRRHWQLVHSVGFSLAPMQSVIFMGPKKVSGWLTNEGKDSGQSGAFLDNVNLLIVLVCEEFNSL